MRKQCSRRSKSEEQHEITVFSKLSMHGAQETHLKLQIEISDCYLNTKRSFTKT